MIASRASTATGPAADTIARIAAISRIVDYFTTVETAAARATPGAGIEEPADPPQGVETEIALAATAALVRALVATGIVAATAALATVIAINAFAIRATNLAAVAIRLTAALAAADPFAQEPATPG